MDINNLVDTLRYFFEEFGYLTIFIGSLIEMTPLGWMVPGGIILAVAGFFANGDSNINLITSIIIGTAGAWFAFAISYWLGKQTGMWLVVKLNQKKNAAFAQKLLENHGALILTTSMMANMTRFWVAYIAGVEKYSFRKFSLYSLVASFSWATLMVLCGYIAGYERQNVERLIGSTGLIGWVILGVVAYVLQRSIRHEYKHFKEDKPHHEDHKTR